jgi:HTH-type transcriptional regulator / antitoxin HigA
MNDTNSFNPDWLSPPGDTIVDILEERDWTIAQLAGKMGFSNMKIQQLIDGKLEIDESIAGQLAEVLGSTEKFWLNRERLYRERLTKLETPRLQLSYQSQISEI